MANQLERLLMFGPTAVTDQAALQQEQNRLQGLLPPPQGTPAPAPLPDIRIPPQGQPQAPQAPQQPPRDPFAYDVPEQRKGVLGGLLDVVSDPFTGNQYKREYNRALKAADEIGKQRKANPKGSASMAANQGGFAVDVEGKYGKAGQQWQVKRNPYTGEVTVWERPVDEDAAKPPTTRQVVRDGLTVWEEWTPEKGWQQVGSKAPEKADETKAIEEWNKILLQSQPNQDQSKSRSYVRSVDSGLETFEKLEAQGYDPTQDFSMINDIQTGGLTSKYINNIKEPKKKQFLQAAQSIINAKLRRESGATITPDEFALAYSTVIPVAGDDPQTKAQKYAAIEQLITDSLEATGVVADEKSKRLSPWSSGYKRRSGKRNKTYKTDEVEVVEP